MNKQQKEVLQSQLNSEEEVIKELKKTYKKALEDCKTKIELLSARAELNPDNLQSIIYQKNFQEAIKAQLEGVLVAMDSDVYATISEYLNKCYEEGYVGVMYDLASQGIPLVMPIDPKDVMKAVQTDSQLSSGLYKRLGEDVKVLKKAVSAELSRGIANGYTWNQTAANLARNFKNTPFNKAYNNSIRIARTEGHRVQTQSALDAQHKAKAKGADIVKQWDASLDGRTRTTHRQLDGQIREIDEPFEVGGMKADAPGMFGDPSEDCNCRCALLQRARWALGEEELQTLKDRAEYYELDKSDDFEDFKKKYLNISQDDIAIIDERIENDIINKPTDGRDLIGEIDYKNSQFDYDIETAMNAQGFDGVPKVVPYEEFSNAMQKSGFYAERTYCASSQELLDEYRNQLYNGKWYVDCSEGGAQYGQGMYCAAVYDLNDKKHIGGIGYEMSHYQEIGLSKGNSLHYTEAVTLQPDAKIFNMVNDSTDIINRYTLEYTLKNAESKEAKDLVKKVIDIEEQIDYNSCRSLCGNVDFDKVDSLYEERNKIFRSKEWMYDYNLYGLRIEANKKIKGVDAGALAVEMGYDAINAIGHGESGSYTVILNRTKAIFCEGGSIYGN